jgi:hypothetical protein
MSFWDVVIVCMGVFGYGGTVVWHYHWWKRQQR